MYSFAVTSSCSKILARAPIGLDMARSTESDERSKMFRGPSVDRGNGEGVRGNKEAEEVSVDELGEEEVGRSPSLGVIQAGVGGRDDRATSRSC